MKNKTIILLFIMMLISCEKPSEESIRISLEVHQYEGYIIFDAKESLNAVSMRVQQVYAPNQSVDVVQELIYTYEFPRKGKYEFWITVMDERGWSDTKVVELELPCKCTKAPL